LGDPVFRIGDEEMDIDWRRLLDLGPLGFGISVFPLVREIIILADRCGSFRGPQRRCGPTRTVPMGHPPGADSAACGSGDRGRFSLQNG